MSRVGRRTKYGEPLSERVPIYFTPTQLEKLTEYVGETDLGSWLRELALQRLANQAGEAGEGSAIESAEAGECVLRLSLPQLTAERLEKLGPDLHQFTVPDFAEWLLNAAAVRSPEEIIAFLFPPKRADGGADGERDESGKNPSEKPKRARKVA